jgi:antitoxin component YwqK of YwqJK toxin-antitoxin module
LEHRNLYLLIFIFSISFTFGQKPDKDFHLNKSLKQDGYHYQFSILDEDKRGVWSFNKTKFYFWYKAQHILSTQGGGSGELLNGDFIAYHENKQLAQKGSFHKGLKDGKWMYWRTDGTLMTIESWRKGILSGEKEVFNDNGESIETVKFSRIRTIRTVSDSIIISNHIRKRKSIILKDANGKVIEKQHFKNGVIINKKSGKLIPKFFRKKDVE